MAKNSNEVQNYWDNVKQEQTSKVGNKSLSSFWDEVKKQQSSTTAPQGWDDYIKSEKTSKANSEDSDPEKVNQKSLECYEKGLSR